METVAVLGSGGWGTAIAVLLARDPERRVRLWCASVSTCRSIQDQRENGRQLPGVPIPAEVHVTDSPEEAVSNADLWIIAIPTAHLRVTLGRFQAHAPVSVPVVSLTKGLEIATFRRPSEIIREVLGATQMAVLSGPSHAEEVSRGMPTSVSVAADSAGLADQVQVLFNTERFRVYTNPDLVGVELSGALKNVIGIAAGICDGLGYGDNAKSALVTRGLVEIARFGKQWGAHPETFQGLAGMGDLITTCFSPHGRNRRLGERLGRGESLEQILAGSSMVVEGVGTTRSVQEIACQHGIELPIIHAVYRVLFENKPPLEAVSELMERRLRSERELYD